jgi:plasmid stability protein
MEAEARDILRAALAEKTRKPANLFVAIRRRIDSLGGVELDIPHAILSANRRALKIDCTRHQCPLSNAASRTSRFPKSLDKGATVDQLIHDNDLRS